LRGDDIEVQCRELATPSKELHDMAKKRRTARRRVTRKPARKRHRPNPEATLNTLVILVVIVLVLGGLYLYAQNKKQAALWPSLIQTVSALVAPAPAPSPQIAQPLSTTSPPVAQSPIAITAPEITGRVAG
jgi:hypothetical protein